MSWIKDKQMISMFEKELRGWNTIYSNSELSDNDIQLAWYRMSKIFEETLKEISHINKYENWEQTIILP